MSESNGCGTRSNGLPKVLAEPPLQWTGTSVVSLPLSRAAERQYCEPDIMKGSTKRFRAVAAGAFISAAVVAGAMI
jgi:hypothetical protein